MHFPISCNSDEISVTGDLPSALCGRWLQTGEGRPWGTGFCSAGEQLSQWGLHRGPCGPVAEWVRPGWRSCARWQGGSLLVRLKLMNPQDVAVCYLYAHTHTRRFAAALGIPNLHTHIQPDVSLALQALMVAGWSAAPPGRLLGPSK